MFSLAEHSVEADNSIFTSTSHMSLNSSSSTFFKKCPFSFLDVMFRDNVRSSEVVGQAFLAVEGYGTLRALE